MDLEPLLEEEEVEDEEVTANRGDPELTTNDREVVMSTTQYTHPAVYAPVMYPSNGFPASISSLQTSSPGFAFKKRLERIDWKKIASVDVDAISRNLDFRVLQDNIMNVTFCNIEAEIDVRMIDPNFIKLFKLAQFTIEYLLHSQDYLSNMVAALENKLKKVIEEHDETKKAMEKLEEELSLVKKESHKRKKMIIAQQQIIQAGTDSYNKCPFCTKAFVNGTFLQSHLMRRHSEYVSSYNSMGMSQPQPPPSVQPQQAPPAVTPTTPQIIQSTPAPSSDVKQLEQELNKIKERLKQTESQLVEERNARNSLNQRERDEEIRRERELQAKLKKLQAEHEENHKQEINSIIETFTRELREMSEKYQSSQEMLSDLQCKLGKASNLGMIQDDIENEKELLEKQREEVAMLKERLEAQMHQMINEKLATQEEKWKAKLNALQKEHKRQMIELNNTMKTTVEEVHLQNDDHHQMEDQYREQMERLEAEKEKEDRHKRHEIQQAKEKAHKQAEEVARKQAFDNQQEETPVVKVTGVGSMMYDDSEDDNTVTQRTNEQTTDYEGTSTFTTTRGTLSLGQFGTSLSMTEPPSERLLQAKQKNPSLLDQFRKDNCSILEQELRKRGIDENAKGLTDRVYRSKLLLLKNERQQLAKKYRNIFDIRQSYLDLVEHQAKQKYKEQQKYEGTRPKSPLRQQSYSTTTPGKHPAVSGAQGSEVAARSQARQPASHHAPIPAPRSTSPPAGHHPSGQSAVPTRSSVGSSMATTVTSSTWDDDEDDEDEDEDEDDDEDDDELKSDKLDNMVVKNRPPVTIPGGQKPVKNTRFADNDSEDDDEDSDDDDDEDDDDEDDDNWDEISGLDSMEPSPRKTPRSGGTAQPRGQNVAQLSRSIERQLSGRKPGVKPAGAVDIMNTSDRSTPQKKSGGYEDDDRETESFTSLTSFEEEKAAAPRPVTRRGATSLTRSTATDDTNTYGTSVWGSTSKGVSSAHPSVSSSHSNTYTAKTSEAVDSDGWDTDNLDT